MSSVAAAPDLALSVNVQRSALSARNSATMRRAGVFGWSRSLGIASRRGGIQAGCEVLSLEHRWYRTYVPESCCRGSQLLKPGRPEAAGRRRCGAPCVSCVLSPGTFAPALLGSWREAAMVPSVRARRTYSTLHAIHNSREFRGSRACTGGMACAFRLPARRPHPAELWRVHNSRLGARGGLRLAQCCACGLVDIDCDCTDEFRDPV